MNLCKLDHLGLKKSPAKSTVGDVLREYGNEFFKESCSLLLNYFKTLLSVNLIDKISFENSLLVSKIVKTTDDRFNEKAIRVISILPRWQPGHYDGKFEKCSCGSN